MTIIGESAVTHARRVLVSQYGDPGYAGWSSKYGGDLFAQALSHAALDGGLDDRGDRVSHDFLTEGAEVDWPTLAILSWDEQGFVYAETFDTAADLSVRWNQYLDEYVPDPDTEYHDGALDEEYGISR